LPKATERICPAAGTIWRHWRGGLYRVICVAQRECDGRMMVVYEPLDGGWAWARDAIQWHMIVTSKAGERVPRFTMAEELASPVERVDVADTNPAGRDAKDRGPEY